MPAAPKRADAPITAADAAMAEHVLREKFEEYRKTFKQQAFDIVVDRRAPGTEIGTDCNSIECDGELKLCPIAPL